MADEIVPSADPAPDVPAADPAPDVPAAAAAAAAPDVQAAAAAAAAPDVPAAAAAAAAPGDPNGDEDLNDLMLVQAPALNNDRVLFRYQDQILAISRQHLRRGRYFKWDPVARQIFQQNLWQRRYQYFMEVEDGRPVRMGYHFLPQGTLPEQFVDDARFQGAIPGLGAVQAENPNQIWTRDGHRGFLEYRMD